MSTQCFIYCKSREDPQPVITKCDLNKALKMTYRVVATRQAIVYATKAYIVVYEDPNQLRNAALLNFQGL